MANKIIGDSTKLLEGRVSRVSLRGRFPLDSFVVLILLLSVLSLGTACGRTSAAPSIPSPEVEVATVLQKDVPIVSEWVATLDGYVNAQIQPQVAGYIIHQTYKEGSFVRKGQVLFEIDPRPFQALLDQANAQSVSADGAHGAHLGPDDHAAVGGEHDFVVICDLVDRDDRPVALTRLDVN